MDSFSLFPLLGIGSSSRTGSTIYSHPSSLMKVCYFLTTKSVIQNFWAQAIIRIFLQRKGVAGWGGRSFYLYPELGMSSKTVLLYLPAPGQGSNMVAMMKNNRKVYI
jgi:hypothetical protein